MINALGVILSHFILNSSGEPLVPEKHLKNSHILFVFKLFFFLFKNIQNHDVGYNIDTLCSQFWYVNSVDKQMLLSYSVLILYCLSCSHITEFINAYPTYTNTGGPR